MNAVANFCFLTQVTNHDISDKLPEKHFPLIEEKYPRALATQWIGARAVPGLLPSLPRCRVKIGLNPLKRSCGGGQ